LGRIYQNKDGWINLCRIYQVESGCSWVGSKKIKLRKYGSGLGQIYQVELGLIRVGSKKIKLRKDGSGLGQI